MKKILLPFLAAVLLAAGCGSGSDDNGGIVIPPPAYKDNITFIEVDGLSYKEAELTKTALILADGVTDRPTRIHYGIRNDTSKTYQNVTFSVDPPNEEKYTFSDNVNGGEITYSYHNTDTISISVTPHVQEVIRFKVLMKSSNQETLSWPVTVGPVYILQPAYKGADGNPKPVIGTMDMTGKTSEKFYIFNYNESGAVRITGLNFENNNQGFSLDTNATDPVYTSCFAADGTPGFVRGKDICFIQVNFNAPSATARAQYTDTLNITHGSQSYKNSSITLSATVQ